MRLVTRTEKLACEIAARQRRREQQACVLGFVFGMIVALAALLLLLPNAKAETIKIRIIRAHAENENGLSYWQLADALNHCRNKLPLNLQVLTITNSTDGYLPDLQVEHRYFYWRHWADKIYRRRARRSSIPRLVVYPPLQHGNLLLFAGLANTASYKRRPYSLALTFSGHTNSFGADRVCMAGMVICHELGHLLGAEHGEAGTIMDKGLGAYSSQCPDLWFSEASRSKMLRYVKKVNRRWRKR